MTPRLKVVALSLSLLAVPALAAASQRTYYGPRLRAEIRRDVRESIRQARMARFQAARDMRRALAMERRERQRMAVRMRRDLRRSMRGLDRRARWD
jgi:hypothetical protein